jgi:microfibrillar-associated protein 1
MFMQKYYHKGAFYQDSNDEIFKRDYNLPTPMEMQDKSNLPMILQKRKGNFGKKGQSKYTHLTQ